LPSAKYGGVGAVQVTFDSLLRLVNDIAGEASSREAARRLGFTIASGNDDMHLKNWSLLWGNAERPELTPCYDLVSTVAWRDKHGWGVSGGPQLALSVGNTKRFVSLQTRTLDVLCRKSGLSWAATEVQAGIARARDAWLSSAPDMPELMLPALEEHWQSVPLLYQYGPLPK
jgi:serine/threonine-protein kinase HipA